MWMLYSRMVEERVTERRKNGDGVKQEKDLQSQLNPYSRLDLPNNAVGRLTLENWYRYQRSSDTVQYSRPTNDYQISLFSPWSYQAFHIKPSALDVMTIPPSASHPTLHTASL